MTRIHIATNIPTELAHMVRRLAEREGKSVSAVVEDAIIHAFADRSDAEQAAIMAKLDGIARRLGVIEKGQETHFELSAHAARFAMSVAPEIPEADKPALNARGSARFQNVMTAIAARLARGRSVWRENFIEPAPAKAEKPQPGAAAE